MSQYTAGFPLPIAFSIRAHPPGFSHGHSIPTIAFWSQSLRHTHTHTHTHTQTHPLKCSYQAREHNFLPALQAPQSCAPKSIEPKSECWRARATVFWSDSRKPELQGFLYLCAQWCSTATQLLVTQHCCSFICQRIALCSIVGWVVGLRLGCLPRLALRHEGGQPKKKYRTRESLSGREVHFCGSFYLGIDTGVAVLGRLVREALPHLPGLWVLLVKHDVQSLHPLLRNTQGKRA